MKNNLRLLFALLTAASVGAAPLAKPTAVHSKPEASAYTIAVLKAGTEPTAASNPPFPAPAGWMAVELGGAHEVFVQNKDITKSLDVRAGATFRTAPQPDAPIFATMEKGDRTEITGYQGRWTRVRLEKKIVGYIQADSGPVTAPIAGTSPATGGAAQGKAAAGAPPPPAPAPAAPAAYTGGGRPIQLGDGGAAELPRLFQGKFVSTRRPLMPRRPYDWQLSDSAGGRYAYLDVSKLLLTEKIEKYIDHTVVIYGTAKPVPNSKDIVIEVDSLQLR